jgi:hypothetical protein
VDIIATDTHEGTLLVLGEESSVARNDPVSGESPQPGAGLDTGVKVETPTSPRERPSVSPITAYASEQSESPAGEKRRQSADTRYKDEVLMPLLVRRRAEARFKEASYVHEKAINQMKAELQEIERRTVKQQNWMKQVDAQVLKTELTKTSYQVRIDNAKKRVATLGKDLSLAYENMTLLLEERLEVEDMGAKNDALIWYLHLLGVKDNDNDANFIDNKKELLYLNERSAKLRSKRSQLDDLFEQVRCTQLLASDIVKHSEELAILSEQLHLLWTQVPSDWKDSVLKSVQKGLASPFTMHPVNAIQTLQSASQHVSNAMKSYLRNVAEFENAHAQTNRRHGQRMDPLTVIRGEKAAADKAHTEASKESTKNSTFQPPTGFDEKKKQSLVAPKGGLPHKEDADGMSSLFTMPSLIREEAD